MDEKIAQSILDNQDEIAIKAVQIIYAKQYDLVKSYQEIHKTKSVRDTKYHLQYLAEAVSANSKELFLDYIDWAAVIMENIGIDNENFIKNLKYTHEAIIKVLGTEAKPILEEFFSMAVELLRFNHKRPKSFLQPESKYYDEASNYMNNILKADRRTASTDIMKAFENGLSVKDIYRHIFQPVQWEIGRLWQINEISVAQEHFCTAATQLIMSQLYPHIFAGHKNGRKFVAASVGSELHEIGVRMVADFFEMEGWDTLYLGASTPLPSIISTIKDVKPDILGLSTTITFNLKNMEGIISAIKQDDTNSKTKILVGGYPFNTSKDLWKKMGADGYAPNADEALLVANSLV